MNSLSEKEKFVLARWSYSVGQPIMSDAEYTRLQHYIQVTYPNDPYLSRTWSEDPCPKELLTRIGRTDLIQNVVLTDATESIPSLNSWADLKAELEFFSYDATLSMKHDGWNTQFNYYNGELLDIHTRGRGGNNMNVQRLQNKVPLTIPVKGKVKVVQEVTTPMYLWPEIHSKFGNANPRNAVHTLLAREGTDMYLQLHAVDIHGMDLNGRNKFEVLKELGFEVPLYHTVSNYSELTYLMKEMSENKSSYVAPTDGLVFDGKVQWAIRLMAWEEPVYESFVTGYFEKYSMHRLNPSVTIYPILSGGRTQRQVNLTNWSRIISNNLQIGSPIAFRNASDAIADIDEEVTRLLQKEWYERRDAWAAKVKHDQEVKKLQLAHMGAYAD